MNTNLPVSLYTATGIFKGGADLTIEVDVPNFSTKDDAEAYAMAFRIMLIDGKLYRDDGKGTGVFDESWREVQDSQILILQGKTADGGDRPMNVAIAQWSSVPGLRGDFAPNAWHVKEDTP